MFLQAAKSVDETVSKFHGFINEERLKSLLNLN